MTRLLLFEDEQVTRFLPLTWTRPIFDLRCGIYTLQEAIEHVYRQPIYGAFIRPYLANVVFERTGLVTNKQPAGDGSTLLLNGRLLAAPGMGNILAPTGPPCVFRNRAGDLIGARIPASFLGPGWLERIETLPLVDVEWPLLEWPWELYRCAGERITEQAGRFPLGQHDRSPVHLIEGQRVYISPSATLHPGVVLDATDGPIVIDADAIIMANSVVQGPFYLGPGSQLKIRSAIYGGTSIGPRCKVGGEVAESVFQGFSNKQHDGFLGHSFLGEWCNLGAGTSNSDLKNNYGTVKVWSAGGLRDSGEMFAGILMADHSKTAINSSLNTGSVVGVSSNLFGGQPRKFTPSFSWGAPDVLAEYRIDEAIATARIVMGRRGRTLSVAEEALLRYISRETVVERSVLEPVSHGS